MKEFLDFIHNLPWVKIKEIVPDQSMVVITVEFWAKPGSKVNQLKYKDGLLSVFVKERPIDGEANLGFISFFAKIFETPKSHVEIIFGPIGKSKRIQITMTGKNQSWSSRVENIKRYL